MAFAELSDDLDDASDFADDASEALSDLSDLTLLLLEASACDVNECLPDEPLSEVVDAVPLPLLLSELFLSEDELSDDFDCVVDADAEASIACLRLFMLWRDFA